MIIVDRAPGEHRIALVQAGILTEFHIHRPAAPDGIGALHWARVEARVPAMAGAFVTIGDADAFLPDTEGAAGLTKGDGLVVRVTRAGMGGKGPRVSARVGQAELALGGSGPPRLLRPGPTPLDELCAAFPGDELRTEPFNDALAAETEALAAARADFPGGLAAHFSPSPALTAIDLDGASTTGARGAKASVQFAANRDVLPALARQIRLRNLSGAILIDFAGMPVKRRAALGPALQAALAPDRLSCRLAGFSNLGFAEVQRPRQRAPLHEKLAGPHAAGLAGLRAGVREDAATQGARLALDAAPAVVAALQQDAAALAEYAASATYPIVLRAEPGLPSNAWRLSRLA